MTDGQRNELRRVLLFAAAVLVLVFIARAYAPALDAALVWDDHTLVETDATYREASFGEIMTRPFWPESVLSDARAPYYRPFVLLSFRCDIALGGRAQEFHFTNLLLHLAACSFLAIAAIRAGASYGSALLAMLLWGVTPRLTEAVVWVSGRTDVLCAAFGLAALCVWPEVERAPRRGPWPRALFGGLLLFASCASKEAGLAFVITIGVAVALRGGSRAALVRNAVALGIPLVAYLALRTAAIPADAPGTRALGLGRRVATVFEAIGRYAEMTVDPLHPRTSIGMLGEVDGIRCAAGVFVLVLALFGLWKIVTRGSFGMRLGAALTVFSIAPVLHVVPFTLAGSVTADRLLYLPLAGLAILAASALREAPRAVGAGAVILALVFGWGTRARASDYREETLFWIVAIEQGHAHNTMPRMALASWLLKSGEVAPACRLYEQSVATLATSERSGLAAHRRARESLSNCLARLGRYDESLAMAEALAHEFPQSGRVQLSLAFAHLHRRDFENAAVAFARLKSMDAALYRRYGIPLARLQRLQAEAASFDTFDRVARAEHLAALGRAPDATAEYLAMALDERVPVADREDAVSYLMVEGPIDDAERAIAAVPRPSSGWDTKHFDHFLRRRAAHLAYVEHAPRIAAIGSP